MVLKKYVLVMVPLICFACKTMPDVNTSKADEKLQGTALEINERQHTEDIIALADKEAYKGNYIKALELLNTALNLDKTNVQAYNDRGVIYIALKKYAEAFDDFSKVISFDSENIKAFYYRGMANYSTGNMEKAINDCTKAISFIKKTEKGKLHQYFLGVHHCRGMAYHYLEKYQQAIDDLSIVIETAEAKGELRYDYFNNRGDIYLEKGEYEKAEADYSTSIKLNSNNGRTFFNRAAVRNMLKKYDDAVEDFGKAIQLGYDLKNSYHDRAVIFSIKKEYTRAVEDYTKALQLDNNFIGAYRGRGSVFFLIGEYEKAIEDFGRIIKLAPEDVNAYNGRGVSFYNIGKYKEALKDFDISIKLDPTNEFIQQLQIDAYKKIGK